MTDDEVLACPDCDRTPVVANAPGGRSHGDSEDYRCTRCGWKGDEPRRRERRGDPDLRPDSLAAKLDEADSLDELVTDGGLDQDEAGADENHQQRVVFDEAWSDMPSKLEVLVGDAGFVVSGSPIFGGGRALVQFDENKTGRAGDERHWIPQSCLILETDTLDDENAEVFEGGS